MQLNGVVFPAPECSYSIKDFAGELIYLPSDYGTSVHTCTSQQASKTSSHLKKYKSHDRISSSKSNDLREAHDSDIVDQQSNDFSKTNGHSSDQKEKQQQSPLIPCLFLPYTGQKSKLENQSKTIVDQNIGNFLCQKNGRKSDFVLKSEISQDATGISRKQSILENELSLKMLEKKIGVNFDEVL